MVKILTGAGGDPAVPQIVAHDLVVGPQVNGAIGLNGQPSNGVKRIVVALKILVKLGIFTHNSTPAPFKLHFSSNLVYIKSASALI